MRGEGLSGTCQMPFFLYDAAAVALQAQCSMSTCLQVPRKCVAGESNLVAQMCVLLSYSALLVWHRHASYSAIVIASLMTNGPAQTDCIALMQRLELAHLTRRERCLRSRCLGGHCWEMAAARLASSSGVSAPSGGRLVSR